MKKLATLCFAAAILSATPAFAAITVYDTPGAVQPPENVLLSNGQTGAFVTGLTNQTATSVTFHSLNGETLTAPSNGQARVESTDGSLDTLEFYLTDPSKAFTQVEFNLFSAITGTTSVILTFSNSLTQTYTLGNGQNFFGAIADAGDYITKIAFDTNGSGVSDIRQIRLGGITTIGAVPEPASWLMMITGFLLVGGALRRRTTRTRVKYGFAQ